MLNVSLPPLGSYMQHFVKVLFTTNFCSSHRLRAPVHVGPFTRNQGLSPSQQVPDLLPLYCKEEREKRTPLMESVKYWPRLFCSPQTI